MKRMVHQLPDGNGGTIRAVPLSVFVTVVLSILGLSATIVLTMGSWMLGAANERDQIEKLLERRIELHVERYRHEMKK